MTGTFRAFVERRRFAFGLAVGVLVTAFLTVGIAFAAIPNSSTQVLNGCRNAKSGALRVIDAQAGKKCKKTERPVKWNVRGPAGAPGVAGPAGAQGAPGAAGPTGPPGPVNTAPPTLMLSAGIVKDVAFPTSNPSVASTPSAWPLVNSFTLPPGDFSYVNVQVQVARLGVRCQVTANGLVVFRKTLQSISVEDGDQTWSVDVQDGGWIDDSENFGPVRERWAPTTNTVVATRCYNPSTATILDFDGGAAYQTSKDLPTTSDLT